ncbi:hypothetical protein Ahy_A06g027529 isoform B [Arachis hypogaea]|uniref:Uncharacterized protein n=1 Tax=Arachis hypogaea TaxID=3818 RepID=A0A445CP35_ARAHY|nr:hypothetical protein Ahy_A06g027529 isoform B [Arachis hypogaea]
MAVTLELPMLLADMEDLLAPDELPCMGSQLECVCCPAYFFFLWTARHMAATKAKPAAPPAAPPITTVLLYGLWLSNFSSLSRLNLSEGVGLGPDKSVSLSLKISRPLSMASRRSSVLWHALVVEFHITGSTCGDSSGCTIDVRIVIVPNPCKARILCRRELNAIDKSKSTILVSRLESESQGVRTQSCKGILPINVSL